MTSAERARRAAKTAAAATTPPPSFSSDDADDRGAVRWTITDSDTRSSRSWAWKIEYHVRLIASIATAGPDERDRRERVGREVAERSTTTTATAAAPHDDRLEADRRRPAKRPARERSRATSRAVSSSVPKPAQSDERAGQPEREHERAEALAPQLARHRDEEDERRRLGDDLAAQPDERVAGDPPRARCRSRRATTLSA